MLIGNNGFETSITQVIGFELNIIWECRIFYQKSHQKTIVTFFVYKQKVRRRRGNRLTYKYNYKKKYSSKNWIKPNNQKNFHANLGGNSFQTVSLNSTQTDYSLILEQFQKIFYKKAHFSLFSLYKPRIKDTFNQTNKITKKSARKTVRTSHPKFPKRLTQKGNKNLIETRNFNPRKKQAFEFTFFQMIYALSTNIWCKCTTLQLSLNDLST